MIEKIVPLNTSLTILQILNKMKTCLVINPCGRFHFKEEEMALDALSTKEKLRSLFALCTSSQQVNDRWSLLGIKVNKSLLHFHRCRDRLVVRTLRCGRSNPGSNPGHGTFFLFVFLLFNFLSSFCKAMKYLFQDELCEIQKQKRHHLKTHCCPLFLFFKFNLQFLG